MHPAGFHCVVKKRLPVCFKNPLSNRIANLVPDNFVISAANKELVLQEKQAKLLSDNARYAQNKYLHTFRQRASKDSRALSERMIFFLIR